MVIDRCSLRLLFIGVVVFAFFLVLFRGAIVYNLFRYRGQYLNDLLGQPECLLLTLDPSTDNVTWIGHCHYHVIKFIASTTIPTNDRQSRKPENRVILILLLLTSIATNPAEQWNVLTREWCLQ